MLPVIKVMAALMTLGFVLAASAYAQSDSLAESIRDTLRLVQSSRGKSPDRPKAVVPNRPLESAPRPVVKKPVHYSCSTPFKAPRYRRYDLIIENAASRYGFKDGFVRAVIHVESDFDHRAVSYAGAMGLMQLMPETAGDMKVRDPFDPAQNIRGGTAYLRYLMNRYGDARLALLAYYGGLSLVDRGIIPKDGIHYLKKVLKYYKHYEKRCTGSVSSS